MGKFPRLIFEHERMIVLVELKYICENCIKTQMFLNISNVMMACYPISEWRVAIPLRMIGQELI